MDNTAERKLANIYLPFRSGPDITQGEKNMFGCHNCKNRPAPGTPYEQTPCARCRTIRDPAMLSCSPLDPDNLPDGSGLFRSLCREAPEPLGVLEQYRDELVSALSRAVLVLVRMKNRNPGTYRVVEAKIANPCSSYSQLAAKLCCRKQNIFYHLRRAVEICPELKAALLVPRRRAGRQGIRISVSENRGSHPSD